MPKHQHTINTATSSSSGNTEGYAMGGSDPIWSTVHIGATGGTLSHTHSFTGSSGNGNSLPPYYALALVMRIA